MREPRLLFLNQRDSRDPLRNRFAVRLRGELFEANRVSPPAAATKKPLPVFPEGAIRRVPGLELVDDVQRQEIRVVARAGKMTTAAGVMIPPVFQTGDDIGPQGVVKRDGRADDFDGSCR